MRYKIALLRSKEGYSVCVPGLPGCCSQGATRKEAIENIQFAIQEYLAAADDLIKGAEVSEVEVARWEHGENSGGQPSRRSQGARKSGLSHLAPGKAHCHDRRDAHFDHPQE